jgi:hypothetical protein
MNVLHVDVVKNEFLAGYQEVVARLSIADKGLKFESSDPETWRPIVLRPFVIRGGKHEVDPDAEPGDFMTKLSSHLNDTYLFATEPHSVDNCPFPKGRSVPNAARVLTGSRKGSRRR